VFNYIHHEYPKLARTTVDGARLYETPSGRAYPSITTVTGLLKRQAIQEWRERVGAEEANKISGRASSRGTRVHSLCENYLSNLEVTPNYLDHELWQGIPPLLDRINNIHALETKLYSDHLEVAGTVDCVAEFDGKLSVIDFKTSSKVKSHDDIHDYYMQCSAYAVAFEERTNLPVSQLLIVMAVDDHDPLLFFEKRDNWIEKFKQLREDYRKWKNI
jgi:ATP-dependent exoDNAse (exonuclease V) beta subunit